MIGLAHLCVSTLLGRGQIMFTGDYECDVALTSFQDDLSSQVSPLFTERHLCSYVTVPTMKGCWITPDL